MFLEFKLSITIQNCIIYILFWLFIYFFWNNDIKNQIRTMLLVIIVRLDS